MYNHLVLVQSVADTDLYCIEPDDRFGELISEGTAYEMVALARAIQARSSVEFKRCAVDARTDPVRFWSPRNRSLRGEVSRESADRLGAEILASLSLPPVPSAEHLRTLMLGDPKGFVLEVDRLLPLVRDPTTREFWKTVRNLVSKGQVGQ